MSSTAVILAAGQSKRMMSTKTKVLHDILGDPALLWVLRAVPSEIANTIIVINKNDGEIQPLVKQWKNTGLIKTNVHFVTQQSPQGTAHALMSAKALITKLRTTTLLIMNGDVPLISKSSLTKLLKNCPAMGVSESDVPKGYGRVFTQQFHLSHIVEDLDLKPPQKKHKFINGGIYSLPWKPLLPILGIIKNKNKQNELYLTEAINTLAIKIDIKLVKFNINEISGLNTRKDLSILHSNAKESINTIWLDKGVSILDPSNTLIGPRVKIGTDVLIEPNVSLLGSVSIGIGSKIQTGSRIVDSTLGNFTTIKPYTLIDRSIIKNNVTVGPFSRLREGTELADHVQIGNFVETKKAMISKGSKANHLTYLGDVSIGKESNIGAGVITCNYDGVNKHKTTIGSNVFIGSDTQIIAPIKIEDHVLIAAGTTVTQDIPREHKAKSRVPQVNRPMNRTKK